MKRRSAIILIIALALSSCVSKKKCERYFPPQWDSVSTAKTETFERLRDTSVIVSDESITVGKLDRDSTGSISIRILKSEGGDYVSAPKIEIIDNIIYARCEIDSVGIYLTLKDRYTNTTSDSRVKETVTVEVNKLKWWQKALMAVGIVAILLMALRKLIK